MEEEGNAITYEAVFDILRRERSSDALQKLDERFYSNILEYIKIKLEADDKELLSNVRKMLKEIYEKREKKILSIAIDKCRLGMESANASNLLKEERWLYEKAVELLISGRASILENLFSGKPPEMAKNVQSNGSPLSESKVKIEKSGFSSADELNPAVKDKAEDVNDESEEKQKLSKMVRFLYAVPKFVGKELEVYGPFEAEEIASIPAEIANLLVAKGRAEEIKEND